MLFDSRFQTGIGKACGLQPLAFLPAANLAAGLVSRKAISATHILAQFFQLFLHGCHIRPQHLADIAERCREATRSFGNPIRQIANEEGIEI